MPDNYLSPEHWIVDNKLIVVDNTNFKQWRNFLKLELLHKRYYRSDFSNKLITSTTGCHLHEGIIPRCVVPLSISWHYLIYHEFNCFLLLSSEHEPQPPSREWCIHHAYDLYGKEAVQEWFTSLKWKSKPPYQLT